jgi:hypothetical protein
MRLHDPEVLDDPSPHSSAKLEDDMSLIAKSSQDLCPVHLTTPSGFVIVPLMPNKLSEDMEWKFWMSAPVHDLWWPPQSSVLVPVVPTGDMKTEF